jgi:hypothetical protein
MKIVKHGDIEFYAGMSKIAGETCQGILTGLISMEEKEKKLEITNWYKNKIFLSKYLFKFFNLSTWYFVW